jgi:periplasmic protein TonB
MYIKSLTGVLGSLALICLPVFLGAIDSYAQSPTRIRVNGNVQRAKLIHEISPTYPEKAREDHVEGTVRLDIVIGTDGAIAQIEVLAGDKRLVDAAVDAVRQWRYDRTYLRGKPVEVITTVDVTFHLK